MTRKVDIRRENSSHGRRNALLVTGPTFKPLFVPFTEFIQNSKKEMIKADAEDLAASQKARSERSNPTGPDGRGAGREDTAGNEESRAGSGGDGAAGRGQRNIRRLREKMD